MKIRSDYVSNSSSSSFIVVLPSGYSLDRFIKEAVKSCSAKQDCDYDKKWIRELNNSNRINLEYCLNNYNLLFLGDVFVKELPNEIKGKNDCNRFREMWGISIGQVGKMEGMFITVEKNDEDHIVLMEPQYVSGTAVTTDAMKYRFRSDEDKKSRVNSIMDAAKFDSDSRYESGLDSINLYEITKDTLANTEDLISLGYKVELPKWASDLNALKKRFEKGERLFGIEMSQGGDGTSSGNIYALNGWDSDFNAISKLEILSCECC